MPDALIFVPPDPAARPWLTICAQYCARKKYTVKAVVSDWDDVIRLLREDGVEIVVVGRREHLPPQRAPRIECVTDQRSETLQPTTQRRPQRRA